MVAHSASESERIAERRSKVKSTVQSEKGSQPETDDSQRRPQGAESINARTAFPAGRFPPN